VQAGGASGAAPSTTGRPAVRPQGQQTTGGSASTPSPPPTLTSPTTLPTVQDVTEVLPVKLPDTSLPGVELPPVDTSQLPEVSGLPKLP